MGFGEYLGIEITPGQVGHQGFSPPPRPRHASARAGLVAPRPHRRGRRRPLAAARGSAIIARLGLVAQLVEQRIENPCVGGSIPPRATKNMPHATPTHASGRCRFLDAQSSHPVHFRSRPPYPMRAPRVSCVAPPATCRNGVTASEPSTEPSNRPHGTMGSIVRRPPPLPAIRPAFPSCATWMPDRADPSN